MEAEKKIEIEGEGEKKDDGKDDGKAVTIENVTPDAEKPDFGLPERLPSPEFRWLICGSGGSGKTNMIIFLLLKYYKRVFDRFLILTPTATLDRSWKMVADDPDMQAKDDSGVAKCTIINELDRDLIRGMCETDTGKRTLIILDDFAAQMKLRDEALNILFFRSRHAKNSVIISTQMYKAVPKSIRTNCTQLTFFNVSNAKEAKLIEEEQCSPAFNGKPFLEEFVRITSTKYHFMHKIVSGHKFYDCFDRQIA
jgi:hypothetical protein